MSKEYIISDDESNTINRKDVKQKVTKLDGYLKKVDSRLAQLEKQLQGIYVEAKSKELVDKGLQIYGLTDKYSKEV
jgi:hypothetical protein